MDRSLPLGHTRKPKGREPLNTNRKLRCKTFEKNFGNFNVSKDKVRAQGREEVMNFINSEVGEDNFVNMTECRSESYWDCTVWYWEDADAQ